MENNLPNNTYIIPIFDLPNNTELSTVNNNFDLDQVNFDEINEILFSNTNNPDNDSSNLNNQQKQATSTTRPVVDQVELDNEKDSLIDLTKDNDDILIINETSTQVSNNKNNNFLLVIKTKSRRNTIRKHPSRSSNNESATSNINDINDNELEVIHEVKTSFNKLNRRVLLRNSNRSSNDFNSTIIIDDDRYPSTSSSSSPLNQINKRPRLDNIVENLRNSCSQFSTHSTLQSNDLTQNNTSPTNSKSTLQNVDQLIYLNGYKNEKNIVRAVADRGASNSEPVEPSTSTGNCLQCPICLENYDELKANNKRIMATLCGHVFCHVCLDEHIKRVKEVSRQIYCPSCRSKLTKAKIHGLYL